MLQAIGSTLEESHLRDICASPYYSIVLDEATDLSTHKQLGLVVTYFQLETTTVQSHFLKLIDLTPSVHATADVIADAVTLYLGTVASPSPGLAKLVGASCDGASVMLGSENGVMTRLKAKVPTLVVTCCPQASIGSF